MNSIKRAWWGEEKLWKVFWLYGVLPTIALGICSRFIVSRYALSSPNLWETYGALIASYNIWLLVAVWKCAFNTDQAFWGYLSRILVVLKFIGAMLIFTMDIFTSNMMPLTTNLINQAVIQTVKGEENCEKNMKAYIDMGGKNVEGFRKKCMDDNVANQANYLANQTYKAVNSPSTPSAPPAPPSTSISPPIQPNVVPDNQSLQECQKTMTDFAQQHGINPQQYIDQNQAWLQQCVQHYSTSNIATVPVVSPTATPAATPTVAPITNPTAPVTSPTTQ